MDPVSRRRISSKKPPAAGNRANQRRPGPVEADPNACPTAPLARKQACITALRSKGYDRALTAYNELAHAHRAELERLYTTTDPAHLGTALARL